MPFVAEAELRFAPPIASGRAADDTGGAAARFSRPRADQLWHSIQSLLRAQRGESLCGQVHGPLRFPIIFDGTGYCPQGLHGDWKRSSCSHLYR
jgi:hypothetical protein